MVAQIRAPIPNFLAGEHLTESPYLSRSSSADLSVGSREIPLSRGEKRRRRWGISLSQHARARPYGDISLAFPGSERCPPSTNEYFHLSWRHLWRKVNSL